MILGLTYTTPQELAEICQRYKRLFSSEDGQAFLRHLEALIGRASYGEVNEMIYREGQRSLALTIRNMMNLPVEDIITMVFGKEGAVWLEQQKEQ